MCQQQASKLSKQTHALQNLSKINEELCTKLRELAELKDVNYMFKETQEKYHSLEKRYKDLEMDHSVLQNQSEEFKHLVDSLETERNDAQKEAKSMETRCRKLEQDRQALERRVEECSRMYQKEMKSCKDQDAVLR